MKTTDLFQPLAIDCDGHQLPDKIAELQAAGAVIVGMARGATNGSYRLELHWPQPERKP